MREILFRGKRIDNGEWVEGGYKHEKVGEYLTAVFIIEELTSGVFENHRADHKTVGQYTGLTDKHGTKIFEGDVVKAVINGGPYDKFAFPVGVIAFENGCFGNKDRKQFTPLSSYATRVSFEVIGTIHDNPELVKGETDNA